MADDRDEIQSEDAPVKLDRPGLIGSDAPKLITAAAIGAAVGAAVSHFLEGQLTLRSGDEPPIRIKGGSIHCEILSDSVHWEDDGNPQNWKLSGDRVRRSDDLIVIVGIAEANGDTHSKTYVTSRMRVHYAENSFIQFTVHKHQTKVLAHDKLNHNSKDKRLLRLERGIDSIRLKDHGQVYESADGHLDYVLILDECGGLRR